MLNEKILPTHESIPGVDSPQTSYLSRLLDVLEVIGGGQALSLSEIAERAEVPLSTAHRLVGLLLERRFAARVGSSKRIVAGPALELIGLRALPETNRQARFDATVERLAEVTGESVSLGLLQGDEIVLVARKEADYPLRVVVSVGDVIPAHRSAMGRVILGLTPEPQRHRLLAPLGDGIDEFLVSHHHETELAGKQRYALDQDGFALGLMCVAAPIVDGRDAPVGAISVAGPAARFSMQDAQAIVPLLCSAAEDLSWEFRHGD